MLARLLAVILLLGSRSAQAQLYIGNSGGGSGSVPTCAAGQFVTGPGSCAAPSTVTTWLSPAMLETAAVLPNTPTYNNGVAGVGATLTDSSTGSVLVVDGVNATTLNESILVNNQAAPAQNGIYTLTTVGVAGTTKWQLTRRSDNNSASNIAAGDALSITAGNTWAGHAAVQTTSTPPTVGTTAITWVDLGGVFPSITATAPITFGSNIIAFQAIPAMSVPANTTGGSATPSGSIAYGTAASQLLQLNGSGLVPAGNLPPPTASTLGGVESLAAVSHEWINTISTAGVPSATQPAFSDLSGSATLAQFPSIANNTALGNVSGSSAVPVALTTTQFTALCNAFTSSLSGCAPASGGGTANFLRADGTWNTPAGTTSGPVNAYYVATTGSDSNTGTLASPFLTLAHAISVASGARTKLIYVRGGTYSIGSSAGTCFSNAYGIGLTAGDEGITISYFPPDGVGSAVFDFGSSISVGFCIFNGANDTSIIGIKAQNVVNSGFRVAGGSLAGQGATGVSLTDDTVIGTAGTGGFGACIELIGNVQSAKILRNDVETCGLHGIFWYDDGIGAGGTGLDIEYNFVRNFCTAFSDCGGIYLQNIQCSVGSCSPNIVVEHNYLSLPGGTRSMYLDDWASNVTVEYNTMFSGSSDCGIIHAGQGNIWRYNICDLSGAGGALTTHSPLIQQSDTGHGTPIMTGNVFQDNVIVCNSTSSPCGAGYATLTPTPPNAANVADNLYWNFNNQSGGVSGVANTAGTGATADSNPTGGNPQIRCYVGAIDQSSVAFSAPVYFQGPGAYARGPQNPGVGNANVLFSIPQTGTAPSWGSSC